MVSNPAFINRRVLVIDDDSAVHDDMLRILGPERGAEAALLDAERAAPDSGDAPGARRSFEVDTALRGAQGVQLVQRALDAGHP